MRELGRSSRSNSGCSSIGSASLPLPFTALIGSLVRSLLMASTHARTQGNAAIADIESRAL